MGVNEETDEQQTNSPASSIILDDELLSKEARGSSITDSSSVETEKLIAEKSSEEASLDDTSVTHTGPSWVKIFISYFAQIYLHFFQHLQVKGTSTPLCSNFVM